MQPSEGTVILVVEECHKENIIGRVLELKKSYLERFGAFPTKVHLGERNELEIEALTYKELGDLIGNVAIYGARKGIKELIGLEITWMDEFDGLAVSGQLGSLHEREILTVERVSKKKVDLNEVQWVRAVEVFDLLEGQGYKAGKTTRDIPGDMWFRKCGRCNNPTCWAGVGRYGRVIYIAVAYEGRAKKFSAGRNGCGSWDRDAEKLKLPSS